MKVSAACVFLLAASLAAPAQTAPATPAPAPAPNQQKKGPTKPRPINPAETGGPRGGQGVILRGTVVNAAGAELSGAQIKVTSADPSQGPWQETTDAAGRFQVTGLPVGLYTLEVSRNGFQTARHTGLKLDSLVCSVRLPLSPGAAEKLAVKPFVELRGRVRDAAGDPVPDAQVEFTGAPFARALALLTDADGSFQVPNFQTGSYGVRVTALGFTAFEDRNLEVQASSESRVVTLTLDLKKGK